VPKKREIKTHQKTAKNLSLSDMPAKMCLIAGAKAGAYWPHASPFKTSGWANKNSVYFLNNCLEFWENHARKSCFILFFSHTKIKIKDQNMKN